MGTTPFPEGRLHLSPRLPQVIQLHHPTDRRARAAPCPSCICTASKWQQLCCVACTHGVLRKDCVMACGGHEVAVSLRRPQLFQCDSWDAMTGSLVCAHGADSSPNSCESSHQGSVRTRLQPNEGKTEYGGIACDGDASLPRI